MLVRAIAGVVALALLALVLALRVRRALRIRAPSHFVELARGAGALKPAVLALREDLEADVPRFRTSAGVVVTYGINWGAEGKAEHELAFSRGWRRALPRETSLAMACFLADLMGVEAKRVRAFEETPGGPLHVDFVMTAEEQARWETAVLEPGPDLEARIEKARTAAEGLRVGSTGSSFKAS